MTRMKKMIMAVSAFMTGIMLIQSGAMAKIAVDGITSGNGVVSVSGSWDSGEPLTYKVYKEAVETPGFSDIKGFGEKPFTFDNEFVITFGLNETGEYKIRLSDGHEVITRNFLYADEGDRIAFIEKINLLLKNKDTAAEAINAELESEENKAVVSTIGIDYEKYISYDAAVKNAICGMIAENGENKELIEAEFAELYKEAEVVSVINKGEKVQGGEMIAQQNFSFENVKFSSITDVSKKEWLKEAVLENIPYSSVSEVEKMYEKVCALYNINKSKVTNVSIKIKEYASLLEITDKDEYIKYKNGSSSGVNTTLIENISKSKPNTVELLLKALKEAVANPSSGSSGGSGGGGGGGSSSGGGSTVKNSFAIEDTPKEENKQNEIVAVSKFSDVPESHWAYGAIQAMQEEGVISGVGGGLFLPERTVTREEFVKMIITAFKLEDENAKSHFHDVFNSDWFYPYLSSAYEKGIVTGDDLGLFGVHAGITRQDAVLISVRAMKVAGRALGDTRKYSMFVDEYSISDYAKDAVKELYCAGKINGADAGKFEPKRLCTRAEAAMMIYGISR